jgi:hypothetical protein
MTELPVVHHIRDHQVRQLVWYFTDLHSVPYLFLFSFLNSGDFIRFLQTLELNTGVHVVPEHFYIFFWGYE